MSRDQEPINGDGAWLADQLRRGFNGEPWHGTSLTTILADVDAAGAAAHPLPGGHSIWEIVLHMTSWVRETSRRLGGAEPAEPADGDWPEPGPPTSERWAAALAALAEAHAAAEQAILAFSPERWDALCGARPDPQMGTGVTYAQLVNGLVQHDAYHGGQIALLKKGLRVAGPGAT